MISAEGISALVAQYEKFGWRLRRVLLSPELRKQLGETAPSLFRSAEIIASDLAAAWFSRPSLETGVAWEIRRLDDVPFALVEVVDDDDLLDDVLTRLENDLRDRINKSSTSH